MCLKDFVFMFKAIKVDLFKAPPQKYKKLKCQFQLFK